MGEQETSKPLLKMEMRTANVCTQTLPFLKLVRSDSIDSVAFETSQQLKNNNNKTQQEQNPKQNRSAFYTAESRETKKHILL